MLLEFKASNYRSICEEQTLSLVPASKQTEYSENIIVNGKYEALNAIAIYGANASGKSNLLKALKHFDRLIHLSARASSTTKLAQEPFMLKKTKISEPTRFEITFIIENNIRYRYGFEFNDEEIITEWLYRKNVGREVAVFNRNKDIIEVSTGFSGKSKLIDAAIEATRDNALFLSTCDMLNVEEAKDIFKWFSHLNVIDGLKTEIEEITTVRLWENEEYRNEIKKYLSLLNLGLKDINVSTKKFGEEDLPEEIDESTRQMLIKELDGKTGFSVKGTHHTYNDLGEVEGETTWDIDKYESAGTLKAFHFSGPILYTLINGGVLAVDEIEAKMHPIMTLNTINLFFNPQTNPKNAQLIFATHDTNLLTYLKIRRDQIYFTEKNKWESTEIYSLSDILYKDDQKERADTDKEKRYLEGRYGAIPSLGSFFSKFNK